MGKVMTYRISFTDDVSKQLARLHRKDRTRYERIQKKVDDLREYPKMGKQVESALKGSWRVHVGHFVLMYRIHENEKIVEFYKIEHRDKAY